MLAIGAALIFPAFARAADHGSMGGMDMSAAKAAAPSERHGKSIREAKVEGFKLEYYLLDMNDMMKTMPMTGMDMSKMKSNHLMVYVTMPDGMAVTDAKAGYLVIGPDKAEQKAMTMAMSGGFGADVDLKVSGAYKITAKIVTGGKTLVDEFSHTVK
jgi:hypothetical protein